MDPLARLLDAPRGRDAYLVRTTVAPPWSIRLADQAPLGLIAVLRGSVWVSPIDGNGRIGGEAVEIGAGGVAVAKGPADALLADQPPPDRRPPDRMGTGRTGTGRTGRHSALGADVHLLPGMRLVDRSGHDAHADWALGHRHLGNDPDGSTVLLMGCYQMKGEVTQRLLTALPPVIHLPAGEIDTPLVTLLADEIVKDSPGQSAVLDRLFDLLLVEVLRGWVTRQGRDSPGPYAAQADPVVGPVLQVIHDQPAHGWTIAELAGHAGVSRASLAQRFTRLVGEPPMTYLTAWRVALAADLLLEPTTTLDRVAREVGYSSAFALSTAFKRERGISPSEHRARSSAS